MVACYHGFGTIVALLSHCPFLDVNQQDRAGNTALMLAAQAGVSAAPQLHSTRPPLPATRVTAPRLAQGSPLGHASLRHPLTCEAQLCGPVSAGHVPLVTLLLNYFAGLDLERRDQRGLTALMKAAIRDRSECVAALLMAGVQPHYRPTRYHLATARREERGHKLRAASWRSRPFHGLLVKLASHCLQRPQLRVQQLVGKLWWEVVPKTRLLGSGLTPTETQVETQGHSTVKAVGWGSHED